MMNPSHQQKPSFKQRMRQHILKGYAQISGEWPAIDAGDLFQPLDGQLTSTPPEKRVHMTAKNALVGQTHYRELKAFINRNPSRQFFFWNDHDIDAFMAKFFADHPILNIYDNAENGIIKADLFRLCVLYIYGGFYFDLKSQFGQSLDAIDLNKNTLYLLSENSIAKLQSPELTQQTSGHIIANWFMAALPKAAVIKHILQFIVDEFPRFDDLHQRYGFTRAVWEITGPRMLTRYFVLTKFKENPVIFAHDDADLQPRYACKGAWTRTLIHQHYTILR